MTLKPRFQWRHQYDDARDQLEGKAAELHCKDPSLTQQSFTEDADLNVIAKRFGLGENPMPTAPLDPSYYGDISDAPDLRAIMDTVNDAKARFLALPARLRAKFRNDPAELWSFVNDPDNADEAVKLGLLARQPDPEPTEIKSPPNPPPASTTGGEQTPKA